MASTHANVQSCPITKHRGLSIVPEDLGDQSYKDMMPMLKANKSPINSAVNTCQCIGMINTELQNSGDKVQTDNE